ncbi:hypothetical protein KKB68_02910, partial [Patescibacteria group bacterium]|nr:hypothetical protein [Patescibacteria group bacterium]
MIQKVKNFLLSLVQIKKITFFVFLFFIVLGLTLSLQPAQAFVVDLALNISMGIVAIVLQVVLLAANFFLAIAAWVLSWATSPGFISLPYTSGGIVDIGWTLLRDLANMGFVIALVAIGLGTALRYGEYQAQKALPRLIGVALLINFTPVICGLIIDGSNIAMNFFLEGVTAGKNFVDLTGLQGQIIGDSLGNFFNPRTDPTPLAKTIVLIAFSFIAGIFLLLYSIIFIARYVAIWVLVILSPIAFFCWILPATRKVFNDWWKQFFQWCIIGIVAAFFLYLSDQLIAEGVRNSFTAPGTGTAVPVLATSGFNEMMNSILPYGVALALLFYGFFTAISTSAMGASGIIAGAQKGAKVIPPKVGKWAGKKTATPLGRKIAPKIENLGKRMAGVGSEKAQKSIAEAKGLKRFGWGVRKKMGTTITAGARRAYREVKTSDENEIAAGKKEATNKDSADNFGIINEELKKGPLKNWNRIIGVLNGVVDNGDSNDIQGALRDGTLSGEIVGEALLTALKRGGPPASRPIAKALYGRLLSNPEQFGEG